MLHVLVVRTLGRWGDLSQHDLITIRLALDHFYLKCCFFVLYNNYGTSDSCVVLEMLDLACQL